jgi:hypothetical protein
MQEADMRHLSSESQYRRALSALQDADGYVEALLELARLPGARRADISFSAAPAPRDRRDISRARVN